MIDFFLPFKGQFRKFSGLESWVHEIFWVSLRRGRGFVRGKESYCRGFPSDLFLPLSEQVRRKTLCHVPYGVWIWGLQFLFNNNNDKNRTFFSTPLFLQIRYTSLVFETRYDRRFFVHETETTVKVTFQSSHGSDSQHVQYRDFHPRTISKSMSRGVDWVTSGQEHNLGTGIICLLRM